MWWVEELYLNRDENGYHHLSARVAGTSEAEALVGAEHVYGLFDGKARFVRKLPTAASDVDYETGIASYRAYVRFSYLDESGETKLPKDWGTEPLIIGPGQVGSLE
jgi:hypothetical protein